MTSNAEGELALSIIEHVTEPVIVPEEAPEQNLEALSEPEKELVYDALAREHDQSMANELQLKEYSNQSTIVDDSNLLTAAPQIGGNAVLCDS